MKLVCGVGINDLKNESTSKFYITWINMLQRCYSSAFHKRKPTYIGCSVCEDWLTFSKFKTWMQTQDWEGKQLDKDILFPGNKVYSPETCVFVSRELNLFLIERNALRGEYQIGVCLRKPNGKFMSYCAVNGKQITLGYFNTPEEAHNAWKIKKFELAVEFSKVQTDSRIAYALVERYQNYQD